MKAWLGRSVNEGSMMKFALGTTLAAFVAASSVFAQSNTPILSGGLQFLGTSNAGSTSFQPLIAPVLVVPIGDHWLVESRAELQGFISRENGTSGPYQGQFFATLDYAQLDYIANAHLTVTVGRFLTPFNVYNERYSAVWIRNLQDDPIIFPIGTRTTASSNGGMLRGVAVARESWELNYAAYFSALSTVENLQAGRSAGGRAGVFFPKSGFEVGASYQRFLQDGDYNAVGAYFIWQPLSIPLNVRAEYAHSPNGQGYWLEGTYRFAKDRQDSTWWARLQAVARLQQFYSGTFSPQAFLPSTDTNRFDVGLNYYLPHEIRLNGSYGRKFSSAGNANIWNFQITYRFLFPAWPGGAK
jgi:hypothetical protein